MKYTSSERSRRRTAISLGKSNTEPDALIPNGTYPDPPPIEAATSPMTNDAMSNERMSEDVMPNHLSAANGSPLRSRIEERAYLLYLERGAHEGDALRDWLEAEAQVRREASTR